MGRSDLRPHEATRVAKANALARLTGKVIDWAHARGISWCLEDPQDSRMWDIPDLARLGTLHGAMATCYDACAHGGQRKKAQKLLHNLRELDKLRARCQGGHVHLPWVPLTERIKQLIPTFGLFLVNLVIFSQPLERAQFWRWKPKIAK